MKTKIVQVIALCLGIVGPHIALANCPCSYDSYATPKDLRNKKLECGGNYTFDTDPRYKSVNLNLFKTKGKNLGPLASSLELVSWFPGTGGDGGDVRCRITQFKGKSGGVGKTLFEAELLDSATWDACFEDLRSMSVQLTTNKDTWAAFGCRDDGGDIGIPNNGTANNGIPDRWEPVANPLDPLP